MPSDKNVKEKTLPATTAKKIIAPVKKSASSAIRQKTGGRVRSTLEQKLELAAQRSKIASFHDDTTLESELAALYLGISEKKLEELRRASKKRDDHKFYSLPFYKIFDHGAIGQNQPIQYKLGDLRIYHQAIRVNNSHEAAVNAGLASWVSVSREHILLNEHGGSYSMSRLLTSLSVRRPYFVQRETDGSRSIIMGAWDIDSIECAEREKKLLDFIVGKIEIKFYSFAQAGIQVWINSFNHKNHNNLVESALYDHINAMKKSVKKSEARWLEK